MQQVSPILRISFALVCLTTFILALAVGAGLVPDRLGAVLEGRKALCEQLAVQSSLAVQRGDLGLARAGLVALTLRNAEVLSAGVRNKAGQLLVEVGAHQPHWDPEAASANLTQMQVPIALQGKLWGHAEFRFRNPEGYSSWWPLRNPALLLLMFVGLMGLGTYFVYFQLFFRKIGLAQTQVIPRRVRTTLNTLAEGIVVLDKADRIVLANEVFARLAGLTSAELQGRKVSDLAWVGGAQNEPDAEYPWSRALNEGKAQTGSVLALQNEDQQLFTLSVNSTPILGEDGTPRGAFATFDNLTPIEKKNNHLRKLLQKLKHSREEVRRQNEELKLLATRDPLTGCLNRRAFFAEMETQWASSARYGQPMSCVLVDVDHFKSVNDTHGHGVGDQVLQLVADTLKGSVRQSDSVCRYGGEEFCVLLPHIDIAEAEQAAERLRQAIAARPCGEVRVTASLGVSALSLEPRDPRDMLEQADKCLYAAKRGGRNRVVRWDQIRDTEAAEGKPTTTATPAGVTTTAIPFHAVTALLSALAYRHADTAAHSRRVADLCVATAAGLMTQSELYVLEVAATLHDIGKLGVPDAVLLKPGPLNQDEWKVIRTHEGIGEEILASAFSSPELMAIARNHHCWYGGSPHDPDLPKGTDIPLGARILSIADAFDAIVSDRVYRKGRSREEAFAELRRCAGVQFDPELVERLITAVLARDESRNSSALAVSKQTALKIGVQIEKLASALDAQDNRTLATMASYLNVTARAHGLAPIAELAAKLEQTASTKSERCEVTQLTIDLLDLCRASYRSYLTASSSEIHV
jgi:diguanylate cyclase (GGDEF)-like protein/PAS domain S-box-containing protein